MKGDIKYYKHISIIVFISLVLNGIIIFILNLHSTLEYFTKLFGAKKAFVLQLYFWSALGATIACSLFMKQDKEINELESIKDEPDPTILRYPDPIDVVLYVQRIMTSGFFGVIGATILFAGLGYFDVSADILNFKQKVFFIVFCFLIGMYQGDFITFLNNLSKRLLQQKKGK